MKPLEKLSNVEKGRLLHQLFPQEIPELLEFVLGMCVAIRGQEAMHREEWNNGIFGFDFWLSLIKNTQEHIEQYGKGLHKSSRLFSDQLFDGYMALYMTHALTTYTSTLQHPQHKFITAVDLLFNP
jgi:hypothetical protein